MKKIAALLLVMAPAFSLRDPTELQPALPQRIEVPVTIQASPEPEEVRIPPEVAVPGRLAESRDQDGRVHLVVQGTLEVEKDNRGYLSLWVGPPGTPMPEARCWGRIDDKTSIEILNDSGSRITSHRGRRVVMFGTWKIRQYPDGKFVHWERALVFIRDL